MCADMVLFQQVFEGMFPALDSDDFDQFHPGYLVYQTSCACFVLVSRCCVSQSMDIGCGRLVLR